MASRVELQWRGAQQPFWLNPEASATALLLLFLDEYGVEGLQWGPETILMEIEEDFQLDLPRINLDKLLAAIVLVTTDRFYQRLPDFIHICNVLSGTIFDPTVFDPANSQECAWGIVEASLLSPPEGESPFSSEILKYILQVTQYEGLLRPPPVLQIQKIDNTHLISGYASDPVLYNAVWNMEKEREQDVQRYVRERLTELITEVENLPLRNGDTHNILNRLLENLGRLGRLI